jgi:hypothetical protein
VETLPVIPLAYALPDAAAPRRFRVAVRVLEAVGLAVCVSAFALLFVEVEFVLFTGPLIAAIGSAMVGMAVYRRDWARVGLGAGHVGICVLFITLVNALNWGPNVAELPFKWMGGCYLAITIGASATLLVRDLNRS